VPRAQARVRLELVVQPVGVDALDAQQVPERLDEADIINGDRFGQRAVDVEDGEIADSSRCCTTASASISTRISESLREDTPSWFCGQFISKYFRC
jgi:hypothetical protein